MAADLASDKFWVNKNVYHDAEKKYHENLAKLLKRGQRRLEVGENSDLANVKKIKKDRTPGQKDFAREAKKELSELKAQGTLNKNFKSDCVSGVICKDEPDHVKNNLIIPGKTEKETEKTKKKSKSSKKCEKNKEKQGSPGGVGMAKLNQDTFPKTTLAGEVARARQHIKSSLECMENLRENGMDCMMIPRLSAILEKMEKSIENLTERVKALETKIAAGTPAPSACSVKSQTSAPQPAKKPAAKDDDDDDVDLFGSESDEEDDEAKKIREQRLAEYAAKKSKKPAVVAKSNIILDIKPWDDETDMKEMEKEVRAIKMDGLVWGASKLVPVAFNILKLQIACVIEDDKVSVDELTETLEDIKDYVQSVDIAAFNKV